jgi:alkanesulfonate monooxygenase SsuD/methylene tetrahydromethanopterin reductase-like flavin-dependent oxidoreductase (luciferase family)
MMSSHRPLGAAVVPLENRLPAILSTLTTAERLGYDTFFQNETWAFDATLLLAEAAARTTRLGLATAILGVWNRSAATIAMASSTLAALSGGRFALGLRGEHAAAHRGPPRHPVHRADRAHAPHGDAGAGPASR